MGVTMWANLIAGGQLLVAIILDIIAILGYFKIIKSTDENAKEQQKAINDTATQVQVIMTTTAQEYSKVVKRQTYIVIAFMLLVGIFELSMHTYPRLVHAQKEASKHG